MDWEAPFSHNVNLRTTPTAVLKFQFPHKDGVHFLVKPTKGLKGKTLYMSYNVISQGATFTCTGNELPVVRFYFQYKESQWVSDQVRAKLEPGKRQLSVEMTPDKWSTIYGPNDPNLFKDAIKGAEWVGLIFGDGSNHGVWLKDGSAVFRLAKFTP